MKVLPEGSSESASEIELLDEIKPETFDDPDFVFLRPQLTMLTVLGRLYVHKQQELHTEMLYRSD